MNQSLNNKSGETQNNGISSPEVNLSSHDSPNNSNELSSEEQKKIAGYDPAADELLAKEYQFRQDAEPAEERPVSERGSIRFIYVALVIGGIIGLLSFFYFTFVVPRPIKRPIVTQSPSPSPSPLPDETSELKSQLAFQDQRRTLESAEPAPQEKPKEKSKPNPTPNPKPITNAPSRQPEPRPEPIRSVRSNAPPPIQPTKTVFIPAQNPSPQGPTSPPPASAVPTQPPAEKIDPFDRWAQLAQLGQQRGQIQQDSTIVTPDGTSNTTDEAIAPPSTPNRENPAVTAERPVATPDSPPTRRQQLNTQQTIPTISIGEIQQVGYNPTFNSSMAMSDGERGILSRTPVKQNSSGTTAIKNIVIGTSADARVIVPVWWDERGHSPTDGRFAVQLTEDIMATDGTVALPAGTILITQMNNVSQGNLTVSQSAVAIVYVDSAGNIHQQPIQSGSFIILGKDNQPLVAEALSDRGGAITEQDILSSYYLYSPC